MSGTKWTPGPWQWWTSCSWRRLHGPANKAGCWVLNPTVQSDGQPDITVSEADMNLIAAAPALYEALECFVKAHDEYCKQMGAKFDDPLSDSVVMACSALAAARGETP